MSTESALIQPLQLEQFNDIRDVVEQQRRDEYQKILNWFICGFAVAIIIFLWEALSNTFLSLASFSFVLLVCLLIPAIFAWQIDQGYRKFFTAILIPEFIKRFNMQKGVELQYSLLGSIPESTFNSCGLFREPTNYNSDGLINGKIGNTNFECTSVLAQKVYENTYGNNRKQTDTLFSGLFFIADSNKNFKGTTFVVPDNVESILGHTGHSLQEIFARHRFGHCELVSLEDPEFERDFAVYSSDQIEARYLLTPLLMQQISEVGRHWDCPIHIAFLYGKMFIAIDTPQNWLEPPNIFKPITTKVIQSTQDRILAVLKLTDELGLNRRIWGRT